MVDIASCLLLGFLFASNMFSVRSRLQKMKGRCVAQKDESVSANSHSDQGTNCIRGPLRENLDRNSTAVRQESCCTVNYIVHL
jgi:hypothetical protein